MNKLNLKIFAGFLFLFFLINCKENIEPSLTKKEKNLLETRKETITPGLPLFSESYIKNGNVYEVDEENNFEEVYRNYQFYEAVYDEKKRVSIFKAYEKGEVKWMEKYYYDNETGKLNKKEIFNPYDPEKKPEIKTF
ncbi:MAG: hypothetical protein OEZ22_13780 [Spirochaetia bacterium]|nr:hypothetical protein [Spirochaetia bacterium]